MIELNFQRDSGHYDLAVAELSKHHPYKKLAVFFDRENFLLTKYRDLSQSSAYLILESYDGTVFKILNCNCGYSGAGPRNTKAILEFLNIPESLSNQYIYESGIQINFGTHGEFTEREVILGAAFESRERDLKKHQIFLARDRIFANMYARQLYFVNPQKGHFRFLFNAINQITPKEFIYYIGSKSEKYITYDFPYGYERNAELNTLLLKGPFMMIKGEEFDIICLFEQDVAVSIINYYHMYFFSRPLFYEHMFANILYFSQDASSEEPTGKWNVIKTIFSRKEPQEYYGTLPIDFSLPVKGLGDL